MASSLYMYNIYIYNKLFVIICMLFTATILAPLGSLQTFDNKDWCLQYGQKQADW